MKLQSELDALAAKIATFHEPPKMTDVEWRAMADKTVVALMAGGESSRFSAVLAESGSQKNKNAHELPNGDTMIEMTIRLYASMGIKKFVALVYHNAHSIEALLGDGSGMGVKITYSHDPEHPVGKGGAVRNALENGHIPEDHHLIVANPDDVVLDFPDFARYICEAHKEGEAHGAVCTPVLTPGKECAYTGVMVLDNKIVDTDMYPFIPVPAHVGITVFSPQAYPRFRELFDLREKNDFEQVLFPLLAQEGKLWAAGMLRGKWIAVNDLKSYKQLIASLDEVI